VKVVYLETSAMLAWLLGEARANEAKSQIDEAQTVVTSAVTFVEAERTLIRLEAQRLLSAGHAEILRGLISRSRAGWVSMEISEEVRGRAGRFFPSEPVRTLDAIHLATALLFMRVFPALEILSFDQRILMNARALGIGIAIQP
jgi:predicted nucleic acid-binding protein